MKILKQKSLNKNVYRRYTKPKSLNENNNLKKNNNKIDHKCNQTTDINTIRLKNPEPHTYSFWDFQMGAWPRNLGMLLDALFVNKEETENVEAAGVLKDVRAWEKTSDHAPIYLILKD